VLFHDEELHKQNDGTDGDNDADKFSWTAVASYFLKLFSGNSTDPTVSVAVERADATAAALTASLAGDDGTDVEAVAQMEEKDELRRAKIEAAKKLVSNHEAVWKDCTHPNPKTQPGLGRVDRDNFGDGVDRALRMVSHSLLRHEGEGGGSGNDETFNQGMLNQ